MGPSVSAAKMLRCSAKSSHRTTSDEAAEGWNDSAWMSSTTMLALCERRHLGFCELLLPVTRPMAKDVSETMADGRCCRQRRCR
eukprot:6967327-Prymnesium_polylepis.1